MPAGDDDELYAVSCAELGEDSGDVGLDGEGAEVEGVGDLAVCVSLCDLLEDLELAWGELVEPVRERRCRRLWLSDVCLDEAFGHAGREECFA